MIAPATTTKGSITASPPYGAITPVQTQPTSPPCSHRAARAVHARREFEVAPDVTALSALTGLTSLTLTRLHCQWNMLQPPTAMPIVCAAPTFAAMPRLRELALTDAPPDVLSQFAGQLSKLELVFPAFGLPDVPALADLTRLTDLCSLTLVGPGLRNDAYDTFHDQLAHIPHLTLL